MEDNSKVQSPTRVQTKTESWKKGVESMVSQDAKKKINSILIDVEKFSELEKLFLYLKLPTGETQDYAVRDSRSGTPTMTVTRAEQTHAFNWIRSHLEESPSTSLPKHEVYEDYRAFCESSNHSVLSAADFGKIIKCVFPNIKARRLGTRGNSKYCYSGIRKKAEIKPPSLPSLDLTDQDMADSGLNCVCNCNHHPNNSQEEDQTMSAASFLVCEWAQKLLGRAFDTLLDLARYLVGSNCVSTKSMAAFTVLADMEINCRSSKSSDYGLIRRPALVQPHQEARRQLQRKIQERKILKFQKEMSEHQSNIESHSKVKSEVNNADKGKSAKMSSASKEVVDQSAEKVSNNQMECHNVTFKPIDKQVSTSQVAAKNTTEVMTVKPTNTTTDSLPSHGNSPRNQVTVATSVSASATCQVTVLEGQETTTSSVTYQPTTATDQYSKVASSEENTVQVDKTQTLTSSVPISQTVMTSTMSNQLQTPPATASTTSSKFSDVPFSPTPVPTQQQPTVYDSACVPTTPQQQRNGPYRIHTCTSVTNTAQSISTQPANKNCNESTTLTQLNSQGIDATDGITSTTPFNSPPSNDSNAAKQGNTGSVLMAALSSQSSGNLTMGALPPISTVCRRVNMAASNDSAASRPNHTAIHSNMGLWNDTARETTQNIGYPVALSSDHMTSTDVVQSVSNINTTARNYLDATALAQPQNGVSSSVSMETASSSVISVSPATRSLMSPSQPDGVMAVSPIPTTRSNVGIMHMVSPSPNALRRPSVGSTPSTTPLPAGSVPSSPLEHCNNSNPFGFTPIQNGSGFGTTNVTVNNLSPIKPTQRVPTTCSVGMPSQTQATGATRRNSLSQQRQQSYPYSVNRNGSNNRIQMNNAQSGIRNTYLNISKDSHNNGYGSSYGSNVNVPFQPRSNHPPTTVSCSNVNQALTFTSPPDQSHMSGYVSGGNQLQTNTCNQNTAGYSSHGIAALGLATANRSHSAPLPQVIPGSTNGQTPWQLEHQNPQSYAAKRNLTQILETDHMETPLRELELSDADFEIDTVSSHSVGNSLPAGLQSSYGLPHPLTQQYLSNQPTSAYDTTMDDMEANAVFQDFYHTPNRSGTTGTPPSNMNFDLRQWQVGNNDSNSAQTSMSC